MKSTILIAVVIVVGFVAFLFYPQIKSKNQPPESIPPPPPEAATTEPEDESAVTCQADSDCLVFGQDGDCNCGCFNRDYSWEKQGDCFCAAPRSCQCVDGQCQGVFEDQAPEPENCIDETTGAELSYQEALEIAQNSDCVAEGSLKETRFCNENTGTWWIDLEIDQPGCNPACVINVNDQTTEINWRCTGLIPED